MDRSIFESYVVKLTEFMEPFSDSEPGGDDHYEKLCLYSIRSIPEFILTMDEKLGPLPAAILALEADLNDFCLRYVEFLSQDQEQRIEFIEERSELLDTKFWNHHDELMLNVNERIKL